MCRLDGTPSWEGIRTQTALKLKTTQSWMSTHVSKDVQTVMIIPKGQSAQAAVNKMYQNVPVKYSAAIQFTPFKQGVLI